MTTLDRWDKCICSFTTFNPETVPYILMTKILKKFHVKEMKNEKNKKKKWKMAEFILSIENQWGYWEKAISIHHAFDLTSMTHIWDKIPWKKIGKY